jgi:hypothetical protein
MVMENSIKFTLHISAENTTEEDIDSMTRQLLSELRELDVESVELTRGGPAPAGSKGLLHDWLDRR